MSHHPGCSLAGGLYGQCTCAAIDQRNHTEALNRFADVERDRLADLERELAAVRCLLELNAKIEAEFVDGSPEKAVAEICRLTHESAALRADLKLQDDANEILTRRVAELTENAARFTTFLTMLQTDFHATPMWEGGAWCIPRLMDGAGGFGGGVVYDRYESFTAAIDAARKATP